MGGTPSTLTQLSLFAKRAAPHEQVHRQMVVDDAAKQAAKDAEVLRLDELARKRKLEAAKTESKAADVASLKAATESKVEQIAAMWCRECSE